MSAIVRRPAQATGTMPFMVIWEVTQACDLVCLHCRANAQPALHPRSLTTEEGKRLFEQIASFGPRPPLLVLTGGDPFKRPDLYELIEHARKVGLVVAVSPSATPLLTRERLARIRDAGASAISLSLDASNAEAHDAFRGVPGSYELTLRGFRDARELGLKVQINSTVTRRNLSDLVAMTKLVRDLDAMTWSVFFLVPMGRGAEEQGLLASEAEAVLHYLVDASRFVNLKTTEAHHHKRVVLQRMLLERMGNSGPKPWESLPLYQELKRGLDDLVERYGWRPHKRPRRSPMQINSGNGFVFVSHLGEVMPSGFLPLTAGSVRRASIVDIYRDSPLMRSMRNPDLLGGRCGRCEFRSVCGGSRSRAFAVHGDPLAEEPWCSYEPGSFPRADEALALLSDNGGAGSASSGDAFARDPAQPLSILAATDNGQPLA